MARRHKPPDPATSGAVSALMRDDVKDTGAPTNVGDVLDTHLGCWGAAHDLFYKIADHRGESEAKLIFRELGSPSAERLRIVHDELLLRFCEEMKRDYKWSVQKCARELAKLNGIFRKNNIPKSVRYRIYGTRGSESEDALRHRIKEAMQRKSRQARPKR
jgi:hypothetical protein